MKLSENIFRCRTVRNWSQNDLADALGVSRQSISKWENGVAVPDLDRLVQMSILFEVTLDELVMGDSAADKQAASPTVMLIPPARVMAGGIMLVFGMVFFLLSVFWGDHLYFGEVVGELFSAMIVLTSIALIATNRFSVLAVCAVIYLLYSIVCFGILHVSSMSNYLFTYAAGWVLLIWFLVCGHNANKRA